jgi:L-ectoine synthase
MGAMKVVKVADTLGTEREVHCPHGGFISYRMALAKDGMGFSVHYTVIPQGGWQHWHYKRHLEACFCIKGRGWLKEIEHPLQRTHLIEPGTMYLLDSHDDHMFKAETVEVVLISIFNPAVAGNEVHDADGSY